MRSSPQLTRLTTGRLTVYFHVCRPHSIVSDFGAPPPLADLATLCKILKATLSKTLARHLTRKLSQ